MTEHGNSFLKSIISSYKLHSFFRHLILKLEILRQPVTKYTETANILLTHNIEIGEGDGGSNRVIFTFF